MGEFKEIPQTFRVAKMIEFWANLVQNLDEDCHDSDLFMPAAVNISRDRVAALIRAACTEEEIKQMGEVPMRRFRLDLGDSTEDMLQAFWNAPKMRRKCKAVLRAVHKEILRGLAGQKGSDALEQRLGELQRVLKLGDLEREVLTFAYLHSETCLSYPRRVDVSERPLFIAMALDRAYGEVLGAMGPKGRLHKFHLLDNDWDFNARAYGAYDEAEELDAIPNLCPGDFRTVRQSQYYLGGEVANADRLAALRAESEAKPKTFASAPMGF